MFYFEDRQTLARQLHGNYKRGFKMDSVMLIDVGTGLIFNLTPTMAGILEGKWESFLGKQASDFPALRHLMPSMKNMSELRHGEYFRRVDRHGPNKKRPLYMKVRCNFHQRQSRTVMRLDVHVLSETDAKKQMDEEYLKCIL